MGLKFCSAQGRLQSLGAGKFESNSAACFTIEAHVP